MFETNKLALGYTSNNETICYFSIAVNAEDDQENYYKVQILIKLEKTTVEKVLSR